jgi:hypothetical protein
LTFNHSFFANTIIIKKEKVKEFEEYHADDDGCVNVPANCLLSISKIISVCPLKIPMPSPFGVSHVDEENKHHIITVMKGMLMPPETETYFYVM